MPENRRNSLNIREQNNKIWIENLSEISVTDVMATINLLEKGSLVRAVAATNMNKHSSRSHAIFTITLEHARGKENNLIRSKSKFHLVDLAGSERLSRTKSEGSRLTEGININKSLYVLCNVISVLNEDKGNHVPYRENKLTRLLQDSIGGNSHTLMLACIDPDHSNMMESLNTLNYANLARNVKNNPIVNIDLEAVELQALKQQLQEQKDHIFQQTDGACFTKSTL